MAAIGNIKRRTHELVKDWVPEEEHDREYDYQQDLQQYLDTQLNSGGRMGQQSTHVVETEHGQQNADIAVDDTVAIELKQDLTNSNTKKLRGQIDAYQREYDGVIACACGIEDMSGWRRLQNDFADDPMDMGMDPNTAPVRFVHKATSEIGTQHGGNATDAGMSNEIGGELDFEDMTPIQQIFMLLVLLVGVGYLLFTMVL
ncbi:hypothetical protein [Halorubrum trapanicum]|uniref:hypothetical protein n=1 Tax=Halorubrum trapanicum TaxID=29284 RepID=UPI000BBAB967|nr:hypothetical protein [Halorubrum trapanicum]